MRKYFVLFMILGACWWGCDENEIAIYQETPRLNFYYSGSVVFVDTDYVKQHTEKELIVEIALQGEPLEEGRTFCVTAQPVDSVTEMTDVVLADSYVFPAGKYRDSIRVTVRRPSRPALTTPQTRASLAFDPSNPAHEFEPGKTEDQSYTIVASFYLPQPRSWNSSFWGLYSTAKYMFMMDCLGDSFQNSWNNWERVNEVRLAYEEYCADPAHEELLDDEGNPIVFPKN